MGAGSQDPVGRTVHRWSRSDATRGGARSQRTGARKASAVEYSRCTHCRNPIKASHRQITHPATKEPFHDDCWAQAREVVQRDYARRIREQGLAAIFSPYVVGPGGLADEAWLPEQRDDVAAVVDVPAQGRAAG